ncbi:MAG: TonB family protein [Verrucomicrobia bacterium]|nr:TonB family protein [Verrucomicrobiota bacterium]
MKPAARSLQNSIFDWDRPRWNGRLLWLIVFSLGLHFAGLYVFHVVYPSTTSLPPPTAQVSVLNPQNPQDRRLLEWVDLNDPSAISAPKVDESLVAKLVPGYRPTFSDETPDIRKSQASASAQEAATPSLFTPDNLFPTKVRPAPAEPKTSFVSHLEFGPALERRQPAIPERLPASQRPWEPTMLFAGISKEGEVKYLFLLRSSGNDQLDRLAEEAVKRLTFQPARAEAWDTVSFHWGTVTR